MKFATTSLEGSLLSFTETTQMTFFIHLSEYPLKTILKKVQYPFSFFKTSDLAIKRNELLIHAITWKNLQKLMLGGKKKIQS